MHTLYTPSALLTQPQLTDYTIKNTKGVPGETAQWLSTLGTLPKDPSSVSITHVRRLNTACNSSSRGVFNFSRYLYIGAQTHTNKNIYTIKNKIKSLKERRLSAREVVQPCKGEDWG